MRTHPVIQFDDRAVYFVPKIQHRRCSLERHTANKVRVRSCK